MKVTTIGIDLAKRVFQVHGVDHFKGGRPVWKIHFREKAQDT